MLRAIVELVPHYSNCVLIFGMAFERYVLVCRMDSADSILSKQNRRSIYFTMLLLQLLLPMPHYWDPTVSLVCFRLKLL